MDDILKLLPGVEPFFYFKRMDKETLIKKISRIQGYIDNGDVEDAQYWVNELYDYVESEE